MMCWTTCTQPDDIDAGLHSDNRQSKKWSKDHSGRVSQEVNYRLVVLGAVGVGKTTIIRWLLSSRLPEEEVEDLAPAPSPLITTMTSAVGELHRAHYNMDDTKLTLEVLEIRDDVMKGLEWQTAVASGDAFVIVYSVNNDDSLDAVGRLRTELLKKHAFLQPAIVIVANKTDTADGTRHVQNVIAEMVAVEDWGHGYVATSAVEDSDGLIAIFLQLFQQAKFPPDHVMKSWLDLYLLKTSRQRKRAGTFSRLSRRVRKLIGGPQ